MLFALVIVSSNIFYGASNVYATGNQAGLYPAESIDTEQDMQEFKQMLGSKELLFLVLHIMEIGVVRGITVKIQ